jgi:hypothetical protein
MEALRYSAPAGLTIQAESPTNGVGVAADTFESLARMNSQPPTWSTRHAYQADAPHPRAEAPKPEVNLTARAAGDVL